MTIAGVSQKDNATGSGGFGIKTIGKDSYEQGLIGKINNLQQRLQKLNEKTEMSVEEKQEKRKELMQNIADLNAQLRQYRFDKQHEKKEKVDEGYPEQNKKREQKQQQGLSASSMESLVAGDMAMKQSSVSAKVSKELSGKATVLEGEIKRDQDPENPKRTAWKEESLQSIVAQSEEAMHTSFEKMGEALKKVESKDEPAQKENEEVKKTFKEEPSEENESESKSTSTIVITEQENKQDQLQKSIDVRV